MLRAANPAGVEVEEDDIATSCGQTGRLEFSQVLQSNHHSAAVIREETLSCQRGLTDHLQNRMEEN